MGMTNENEDLATRVAKKRYEVEQYTAMLDRYHKAPNSGRWYNSYRSRLQELQVELVELEQEQARVQGHIES